MNSNQHNYRTRFINKLYDYGQEWLKIDEEITYQNIDPYYRIEEE